MKTCNEKEKCILFTSDTTKIEINTVIFVNTYRDK